MFTLWEASSFLSNSPAMCIWWLSEDLKRQSNICWSCGGKPYSLTFPLIAQCSQFTSLVQWCMLHQQALFDFYVSTRGQFGLVSAGCLFLDAVEGSKYCFIFLEHVGCTELIPGFTWTIVICMPICSDLGTSAVLLVYFILNTWLFTTAAVHMISISLIISHIFVISVGVRYHFHFERNRLS